MTAKGKAVHIACLFLVEKNSGADRLFESCLTIFWYSWDCVAIQRENEKKVERALLQMVKYKKCLDISIWAWVSAYIVFSLFHICLASILTCHFFDIVFRGYNVAVIKVI